MPECWCCGQECMLCDDGPLPGHTEVHWCSECKFGMCPDCCGCEECHKNKHGGWAPDEARVSHGGGPLVRTRNA